MNRARLESMLADDAALIKRGRKSALHSARREAMDELRATTSALLNGSPVNTAAIRAACDDLDWLASIEEEGNTK